MRLLTPPGRAGVAVLAAVGAAEVAALRTCLAPQPPAAVAPGLLPLRRCQLRLPGGLVEDALLLVCGEDALELHVHGSPAVLEALRRHFGPFAAPAPAPAEQLLRTALSPAQLDLAMEQLGCDFDACLQGLAAMPAVERRIALAALRARSRAALALATPQRLVLAGLQNAGKSTLMNLLLYQERVLAGPQPGLTRDPVQEATTLCGYPYELVDTAGEGESSSPVDRAAMQRGRALRPQALVLLLVDGSLGPGAWHRRQRSSATWLVATKGDLTQAPWPADLPCDLRISCRGPDASSRVRWQVGECLRGWRQLPAAGPVGGPAALSAEQWQRLEALAPRD